MRSRSVSVEVKKSRPGLGRGLFAGSQIRSGDYIAEYSGPRMLTSLADTLKTRYLFEIDNGLTIDGSGSENLARYINHACEPNSRAVLEEGRVFIYASREIKRGEEITMDYGDEYFEEFIRPTGCKCAHCASTSTSIGRP